MESDKIKDMEEKNLALLASTKVPEGVDSSPLTPLSEPTGYDSPVHAPIRDQACSSKSNLGLLAANTPGDEHILLLQSPETPVHVAGGYPGQSYMETPGSLEDYNPVDVQTENAPESDSEHDACHKFLSSLKPPSDGFLDSLTVCDLEIKHSKVTPPQDLTLTSEQFTESDFSTIMDPTAQLDSEMETWATKRQGQIQSEAQAFQAENEGITGTKSSEVILSPEEEEASEGSQRAQREPRYCPEKEDVVQLLDVEDEELEDVPPTGQVESEAVESEDNSVYV